MRSRNQHHKSTPFSDYVTGMKMSAFKSDSWCQKFQWLFWESIDQISKNNSYLCAYQFSMWKILGVCTYKWTPQGQKLGCLDTVDTSVLMPLADSESFTYRSFTPRSKKVMELSLAVRSSRFCVVGCGQYQCHAACRQPFILLSLIPAFHAAAKSSNYLGLWTSGM